MAELHQQSLLHQWSAQHLHLVDIAEVLQVAHPALTSRGGRPTFATQLADVIACLRPSNADLS